MHALTDIVEGWYLYVKATPESRSLMKRRLAVCDTCPNKVQTTGAGKVLVGLMGNDPDNAFSCSLCHCPLGAMASLRHPACLGGNWNKLV